MHSVRAVLAAVAPTARQLSGKSLGCMKLHLEKVGALGTFVAALAAAPACCLPLLAAAGASLGFGAFVPIRGALVYVVEAFVALALIGAVIGFRSHHKWGPLVLAILSALAIFYAYNIRLSQALIVLSLGGLAVAAIWNTVVARRRSGGAPVLVELQSMITCPTCGFQRAETMPTEACVFFYTCGRCRTLLRPKPGDCCVFCSYGTVSCPPKQTELCACWPAT